MRWRAPWRVQNSRFTGQRSSPASSQGALRQQGGIAQQFDLGAAIALERHAVAGDCQPFAAFQALSQIEHDAGIQFADLDHAQAAAGFFQQPAEVHRVPRMHQHVQMEPAGLLGQRAADLDVAQVRTHQDLAAAGAHLRLQAVGVVDVQVRQGDSALPHVELVEQRLREGQVLAIDREGRGQRRGQRAAARQAPLVGADGAPGARSEDIEIQHHQPYHRRHRAPADAARGPRGQAQQRGVAPFALAGPVRIGGCHGRGPAVRRRSSSAGDRASMPKNRRACMRLISRLSRSALKCETPPTG